MIVLYFFFSSCFISLDYLFIPDLYSLRLFLSQLIRDAQNEIFNGRNSIHFHGVLARPINLSAVGVEMEFEAVICSQTFSNKREYTVEL